ncbi:MAG: MFS transporter [Acidiferrobacterales bacterium]|nr:MFS transporter [Acidiferrobacterales bacterium]
MHKPASSPTQALLLTALGVVLSLMTWFSATAVLPELTSQYALSATQAAWLTNGVQLGFAIGALVSSLLALSDRWPVTRIMSVAAVLAGLSNLLLLADLGTNSAVVARFLTGVSLSGIYPPAMKFIATWFKSGRGFAMGAMVGALTLGSAMPHLVRAGDGDVSWELVVTICSIGSFCAALIFAWALKEGPYAFSPTIVSVRSVGKILKNRPVMLANFGYFGHMWELYAMWGWFLAYAQSAESQGMGLTNASILTFAVIAMGAPGCMVGGWMADRIGRCHTTRLMMGLSGLSALAIGFSFQGPLWLFCVIALIWGFSVVADSAQFSAAVTELTDSELVGSSLAFQMGIGFLITIVAIWITPMVAEVLGSWRWTFLILVPGPLLGIASMSLLRRTEQSVKMAAGHR